MADGLVEQVAMQTGTPTSESTAEIAKSADNGTAEPNKHRDCAAGAQTPPKECRCGQDSGDHSLIQPNIPPSASDLAARTPGGDARPTGTNPSRETLDRHLDVLFHAAALLRHMRATRNREIRQ